MILPYLLRTKKDRVLHLEHRLCFRRRTIYHFNDFKRISRIKSIHVGYPRPCDRYFQNALKAAANAVYDETSLRNLPAGWKSKYFRSAGSPGLYTVSPEIKSNVIFRTFNLMDPIRFRLKFDVIFCRNVMIYFDRKQRILS